jgi:hypothetical protein
VYNSLFDVEDFLPAQKTIKPKRRLQTIATISNPLVLPVVTYYPVVEEIASSDSPSPIIFHEWFLHCIYHYFSLAELVQLARVSDTKSVTSDLLRFVKRGEKWLKELLLRLQIV